MNKYLLSLLLCLPLTGGGALVTVDQPYAGPDDRRERKQDVRSDRRERKQDVRSDRREVRQDVRHERYERHETASNAARAAVAVGAAAVIVNAARD
jgi:hypothetical protein